MSCSAHSWRSGLDIGSNSTDLQMSSGRTQARDHILLFGPPWSHAVRWRHLADGTVRLIHYKLVSLDLAYLYAPLSESSESANISTARIRLRGCPA